MDAMTNDPRPHTMIRILLLTTLVLGSILAEQT
jgi:hypothetical protein